MNGYFFRLFGGVWGCAWVLLVVGFLLAVAGSQVGDVLLIVGGCLTWLLATPILLRREVSKHLEAELRRRGYALTSLGMPGLSIALLGVGTAAIIGGVIGLS